MSCSRFFWFVWLVEDKATALMISLLNFFFSAVAETIVCVCMASCSVIDNYPYNCAGHLADTTSASRQLRFIVSLNWDCGRRCRAS
jgi:hypothetical protein